MRIERKTQWSLKESEEICRQDVEVSSALGHKDVWQVVNWGPKQSQLLSLVSFLLPMSYPWAFSGVVQG